MKKLLALILALGLFVGILSGCTGDKEPAGTDPTQKPAETGGEETPGADDEGTENFNATGYPIVNEKSP